MESGRRRKPGEALFALVLAVLSVAAVWNAYGIAGFEALSSPGAFPMAVAAVMLGSSLAILVQTVRARLDTGLRLGRDILPGRAVLMAVLILVYAIALKPLGFLPTSLAFLFIAILALSRRGIVFSLGVSLVSLLAIYVVFRLLFSVLMPEGLVPEREIIALVRALFDGGG